MCWGADHDDEWWQRSEAPGTTAALNHWFVTVTPLERCRPSDAQSEGSGGF
jgi:hypothetical protein